MIFVATFQDFDLDNNPVYSLAESLCKAGMTHPAPVVAALLYRRYNMVNSPMEMALMKSVMLAASKTVANVDKFDEHFFLVTEDKIKPFRTSKSLLPALEQEEYYGLMFTTMQSQGS